MAFLRMLSAPLPTSPEWSIMCAVIVGVGGFVAGYTDPALRTADEKTKAGDARSSGDAKDAKRKHVS
jgi:hypothetical protein